jgi:DNA-binding CsgD family transcriptional regulator
MHRADPGTKRTLAEIRARLRTVDRSQSPWLADVVPDIAKLIGADAAGAYRLESGPSGLHMDFFHSVGLPRDRFASEFERFASSKNGRYAAFDPVCPQVAQRNVALANDDIAAVSGVHPRSTSTYRELLPRYGMERSDQLRALICEGNSLLAWVGGYRADAFTDEDRNNLGAVLPDLHARLLLEWRMMRGQLSSAVLPVALEALAGPAFIVAGNGRVLEANSTGQTWLAADRAARSETLRDAVQGRTTGLCVVRVDLGAAPPAFFVWRENPPARAEGFDARAREWRLTGRQYVVGKLLTKGLSNKAIATELGCAEKTVEVHVTAVLRKAGVASRAALLSKILLASR